QYRNPAEPGGAPCAEHFHPRHGAALRAPWHWAPARWYWRVAPPVPRSCNRMSRAAAVTTPATGRIRARVITATPAPAATAITTAPGPTPIRTGGTAVTGATATGRLSPSILAFRTCGISRVTGASGTTPRAGAARDGTAVTTGVATTTMATIRWRRVRRV